MSREIRFRGKRIDNGEWVEGYLLKMKDKYFICVNPYEVMDSYSSKSGQCYGFGDFYEVDPREIKHIT